MEPESYEEEQPVLTRTEKRAARTLKSLLSAAQDVFLERGLGAATIEEITERADIGKGTFYIYYSSKTAIFESLVSGAMKRLLARIRAAEKEAGNLRDAVSAVVEAELQYCQQDPKGFRLLAFARNLLQLREVSLPECADIFEHYFRVVEQAIQRRVGRPIESAQRRRIAILLASVSSGYLSFEAFDIDARKMVLAYEQVREAMINAVVSLIESQEQGKASSGEGEVPAPGTAKR
ncbi:MAG: TetR/AcrR family transcriptional regulator [Planctomycetota bacterium]